MTQITKQQFEVQLKQIFRMLLEAKTNEEIAKDLQISVRTVQRYKQRLEKRYGDFQHKKTDNTIFLECHLFKNRLMALYQIAEEKARNPATNGADTAKILEVAANLAIDVLKVETEGIKAVKEGLVSIEEAKKISLIGSSN